MVPPTRGRRGPRPMETPPAARDPWPTVPQWHRSRSADGKESSISTATHHGTDDRGDRPRPPAARALRGVPRVLHAIRGPEDRDRDLTAGHRDHADVSDRVP